MKISNEFKVGILAITGLTVLILGFNFLKGKPIFKKNKYIYAVFTDIGSLENSNEVRINGLPVGLVANREERDEFVTATVVTIRLTRDVKIPDNSVASIESGLVGASYINIQKGDSKTPLPIGDTLQTKITPSLMGEVKQQLTPTLSRVRNVLDTLASTLSAANDLFSDQNKRNIAQAMENINRASSSLTGLVDPQTGPIALTLKNTHTITETLKGSMENVTATVANAKTASEKLAQLELKPTIDSLNSLIANLKSTANKLASPQGTLGALVNDRKLYDKLVDAILAVEILTDDLRTNPKRYVNLSIFGKRDKGNFLTSPAKKDSVPK